MRAFAFHDTAASGADRHRRIIHIAAGALLLLHDSRGLATQHIVPGLLGLGSERGTAADANRCSGPVNEPTGTAFASSRRQDFTTAKL